MWEVEIDAFFNDNSALNEADAYKAPYEKEEYELSKEKFKLYGS